MEIKRIISGFLNNNTYVVSKNNYHILIDPSLERTKIEKWLVENKITPNVILLTHGHFDHIASTKYFQNKFNIDVWMGKEDQFYLEDPFGPLNESSFDLEKKLELDFIYNITKDADINFKDIEIKMIKTPGHTPGSTCYFFKEINVLFTGDTLFKGAIGRTDFQKGDFAQLESSIQNKLYTLKENVKVLSGHGQDTTIKYERENNPMVKQK